MEGKILKLRIHPRNFSNEELIVNIDALAKEKFQLQCHDIIEIFPPEEQEAANQKTHLLLQVKVLPQDVQSKGGPLSISNDVAQAFSLVGVREVRVQKVEREKVGLNLLEIKFKDQCLTRSEMWRFTCSLIGRCVYQGKKLEFAGIRSQVCQLWSQGQKTSCGAIVKSTRVVYRSASAHVFLFIQISLEMWDFDPSGDLYFDKAISGFLKELFEKWKDQQCSHKVSIVFFSRVYHSQRTVDNFPQLVRLNVQQDKRGMFYEDFYKVIVEEESLVDWSTKLVEIKRSFIQLPEQLRDNRGEEAKTSTAAEGNILEAINLAVNVFERHYIDCNFLMAGQQVVIVTAGAGVFEVDHEFTRTTKERIIDGGISADLVSLTEQPLHAVPLFRFHSQDPTGDQEYYHIPHWINYSFYNPPRPWSKFRFTPKLQLSDHLINDYLEGGKRRTKGSKLYNPNSATWTLDDRLLNRVDYERYDADIFAATVDYKSQSTGVVKAKSAKHLVRHHSESDDVPIIGSMSSQVTFDIGTPEDDPLESQPQDARPVTSPYSSKQSSRKASKEIAFTTSLKYRRVRYKSETLDDQSAMDRGESSSIPGLGLSTVGSAEALRKSYISKVNFGSSEHTPTKKKRSFINPFDPMKVHAEFTAYHRCWIHAFPQNKAGFAFQVHHEVIHESFEESDSFGHSQTSRDSLSTLRDSLSMSGSYKKQDGGSKGQEIAPGSSAALNVKSGRESTKSSSPRSDAIGTAGSGGPGKGNGGFRSGSKSTDSIKSSRKNHTDVVPEKSLFSRMFEAQPKGAENFASVRRAGMNWQSLTEPACLPVTSDFFPSDSTLNRDYFLYPSKLLVSSFGTTSGEKTTLQWRTDHQMMNTFQAFREMISQRIAQGFQLVFDPKSHHWGQSSVFSLHKALLELEDSTSSKNSPKGTKRRRDIVVRMSLGRVFQTVELTYPHIAISVYKPKTRLDSPAVFYRYQLWSCEGEGWESASGEFCRAKVEDYNWNYLDQHVCGYPDFEMLGESQKYWRCRYLLLPAETPPSPLFDSTLEKRVAYEESLICNFVRFLEFLNHIKRGPKPGALSKRYMSTPGLSLYYSPYESHSNITSPIPTPIPTPTPTPLSSLVSGQKGGKLTDIHEEEPGEVKTPSRPRSRPISPQVQHQEGTPKGRSKADRHAQERGREKTRTKKDAGKSKNAEPKTSKNLSPEIRRARSREDIRRVKSKENLARVRSKEDLRHQDGEQQQQPTSLISISQLKPGISGSPKILRKRNSQELIKNLKEVTGVHVAKKEAVDAATRHRKPALDRLDSAPAFLNEIPIPPTPTQPEPTSDLEDSLDDDQPTTRPFFSLGAMSLPPEVSMPTTPEEPAQLNARSPVAEILKAMEDPQMGIDFLGQQPGLRAGCFVAMEAVQWVIDNVEVSSRGEASKLLQVMVNEEMLTHASGDCRVPFMDGYFLYCMPHRDTLEERPKDILERSFLLINPDMETFSKNWFEVGIRFPSAVTGRDSPLATPSPPSSPASSSQHSQSPYYMGFQLKKTTHPIPPSVANRYVELNPDPQFKSDRPEWCFIRYDHTYHPTRAFQLELQWMVSTITLFHQLIQSWLHKATMCGFNLVAVPMLQSLSQGEQRSAHPLRRQHFIPLRLPQEIARQWKNFKSYDWHENLSKLLCAVANKFGFLLDPASISSESDSDLLSPQYDLFDLSSRFYVHHTGCAMVQPLCEDKGLPYTPTKPDRDLAGAISDPLNTSTPVVSPRKLEEEEEDICLARLSSMKCGFYWYRNFLLPKQKNIPAAILARHDSLLAEFVSLCSDRDGQLLELCSRLFAGNNS